MANCLQKKFNTLGVVLGALSACAVNAEALGPFAQPTPTAVSAGTVVAVEETGDGDVVTVSSGEAGVIEKTGQGTLYVEEIPSGTKQVLVKEGTLVLSAASNDWSIAEGDHVYATIPNPSFEESLAWQAQTDFLGTTLNGWTASETESTWNYPHGGRTVFYFNRAAGTGDGDMWPCDYDSPAGNVSLAIKGECQVSTQVTIPFTGRYDLSFKVSARYPAPEVNWFDILVGAEESSLTRIGFVRKAKGPYTEYTFRTPYLAAGTAILKIKALQIYYNSWSIDGCTLFDDFKMELVAAHDRTEWVIPGGDFENARNEPNGEFSTDNVPPEWSVDQGPWSSAAFKSVGVAYSGATVWAGSDAPVYTKGETPYGNAALAIFSKGSSATTTFTPPAGIYRLRCRVKCWEGLWIADPYKYMSGTAGLVAYVKVNDGEEAQIADFWPSATTFDQRTGSQTFTVAEGDSVTLRLTQYMDNAAVVVDDLVLVRQEENLLTNGDFETRTDGPTWVGEYAKATGWTLAQGDNKSCVLDVDHTSADGKKPAQEHYIPNAKSGDNCLMVTKKGVATQTVNFPNAGVYRLSCSLQARHAKSYGSAAEHGENPLRFTLSKDGTTRVIADTTMKGTNWLDKTWYFRVPDAGEYTFAIQGQTETEDRTSFVDDVKIVAVGDEVKSSVAVPEKLSILVYPGARLYLNYPGTTAIHRLKLAGHGVCGEMDADQAEGVLFGGGTLDVAGLDGLVIIIR